MSWFDTPTHAPAPRNLPRGAIVANCCGAWWTGLSTCHCAGCHVTFTGISAFDKHRVHGRCVDPVTIGLVPADREWIGWARPGTWRGPAS